MSSISEEKQIHNTQKNDISINPSKVPLSLKEIKKIDGKKYINNNIIKNRKKKYK